MVMSSGWWVMGGWVVVRYANAGVKRAELEIVQIAPRAISTNGYAGMRGEGATDAANGYPLVGGYSCCTPYIHTMHVPVYSM
ncbi:hypothetical protein F4782DRAFT_408477 [Xylaria castorea]|nr:hypothetical protein F4782DRAFT_408477 [Xylaria castorea]